MALTRNQLNTYVDDNVTNKTTPDSLTPTNEGESIKKVADYVDDNKEDFSNKISEINGDSEDLYPNEKAVVGYVALHSLQYLESAFRISQSGTNAPSDSNYYIDQVQISPGDNTDPLFRAFAFNRSNIGMYNMQIIWKTNSASAIDVTKIDISCSDAKIRFGSTSNGSFGPYSYYQQDFEVYDTTGTLSDNVLGSTSIYARLFN